MKCECGTIYQKYQHQWYCSECNKWISPISTGVQPEDHHLPGISSQNYGDDGVVLSPDEISELIMQPEEKQDEIRIAFLSTRPIGFSPYNNFVSGYKSATQKANAESKRIEDERKLFAREYERYLHGYSAQANSIKELKGKISDLEKISPDHGSYLKYVSELEQQIEQLKGDSNV